MFKKKKKKRKLKNLNYYHNIKLTTLNLMGQISTSYSLKNCLNKALYAKKEISYKLKV